MITYQSITSPDNEVSGLFATVKDHFPYSLEQFLEDCAGHFYKVTYDSEFIGCVFFTEWTDKKTDFCGFSKRGTHLKNIEAIRAICNKYKEIYGLRVLAETEYKEAMICLLKSGFKRISERIFEYHG